MRVGRRSRSAWLAIAARTVAILCFVLAAELAHRPIAAAAIAVLAAVLILATFRRKADPAIGALYTSGADTVAEDGKRFPGQLSLTPDQLVWSPSRYSVRHGLELIAIDLSDCRQIRLNRGSGLLDVIVTVVPRDGRELHFSTHTSRRLKRTLESSETRRAATRAQVRFGPGDGRCCWCSGVPPTDTHGECTVGSPE